MKLTKILLVINLFFLQSYLIRFSIGQYPTNLQEVLIFFLGLSFLLDITRSGIFTKTIKNLSDHWIIFSFILLTGLSILIVPIENNIDLFRHLKFLFFAAIFGLIFLETLKKNEERKAAIQIAGIGAIIFGIFSIAYNLLGFNTAPDFRLLGPLDAAVYIAYYLTPFFIFFTIEFLENTKKKSLLIYALLLAILIIATRSMGAIGGSFLVIIIYLFKRSNLKILKSRLSKFLIVIIGIGVLSVTLYTKVLPTIQTNYSSLDERGEIWLTSAELLKDPRTIVFGLGYGQFQHQYIQNVRQVLHRQPLDYYVIQPHNIFLLFIFHYGILGLALIVYLIFITVKNIYKFKGNPDIKIIISFMLLYFFIHGQIDTPFFKNDMLIILLLFLEMGLNQSPETRSIKTA